MPLREWPEKDRAAWLVAIKIGDLLDEQGLAAHWRAKSQRSVVSAYGRYLTFLDRSGWLDGTAGPTERMTPDRLRAFIRELDETVAPVTRSGRIINLAEAFRVMAPGASFPYLRIAKRKLKARARPKRDKRSKLVPSRALLKLGLDLIREAESGPCAREIWRACLYRDGLMILLLSCRPIRRDNIAAMRIGSELVEHDGSYALALAEEQTKNHRRYDRSLPPELSPFIGRYLEHYRPILLGNAMSDFVWISWRSGPMSGYSIYGNLCKRTEAAFGTAISPHLFRDCAVTSSATVRPDLVWLGMSLLHHSDPRIAEKHYDHALATEAVQAYQDSLRRLRGTRKVKSPSRAA
jgi:integrase